MRRPPKIIQPAGVASTVWLFAKEFGWTAEQTLWELSEVQLVQLEHAILVHRGIDVRRNNSNINNVIDSILDANK